MSDREQKVHEQEATAEALLNEYGHGPDPARYRIYVGRDDFMKSWYFKVFERDPFDPEKWNRYPLEKDRGYTVRSHALKAAQRFCDNHAKGYYESLESIYVVPPPTPKRSLWRRIWG